MNGCHFPHLQYEFDQSIKILGPMLAGDMDQNANRPIQSVDAVAEQWLAAA